MKEKKIIAEFVEYNSTDELSPEEKKLVNEAREIAKDAYAPYSNFFVGASILLENGKTIAANNQENSAYPSGLCAERIALFSAAAQNPGIKIKAIAIAAITTKSEMNETVSPCGACRQVIAEYETFYKSEIKIIMAGATGPVLVTDSIKNLLPFLFSASSLKKLNER